MKYLKFFELEQEPFQNDGDVQFYFESARHRRAEMLLMRAAHQQKALSLLIGGPGCGKTTVSHKVLMNLDATTFSKRLLLISHADCGTGWLLPQVARAFGVKDVVPSAPAQLEQLQAALLAHKHAEKHPVLIIDEAQILANEAAMLEFRGILNLSPPGQRLLSIILVGLPELATTIRLDPPLNQRVEVRRELGPLSEVEVTEYVEHRLRLAGASKALFTPEAYSALHGFGFGIPRLINTLADTALFEAFINGVKSVDASLIAAAREQLALEADAPIDAEAQGQSAVGSASQVAAAGPNITPSEDSMADFSMGAFIRKDGDSTGQAESPGQTRLDGLDPDDSADFGVELDAGATPPDGAASLEVELDPGSEKPALELEAEPEPLLEESSDGASIEKVDAAAEEVALAELDDIEPEESIELSGLEVEDEEPEAELELEAIAEQIPPEPETEFDAELEAESGLPDFKIKSMDDAKKLESEADSGTFDPSELLEDSAPEIEVVTEPAEASPETDAQSLDEMFRELEQAGDQAAPKAEATAEEGSEDLDDLFDSIQVSN